MKTVPWSSFVIALSLTTARADLTIVQQIEGAGPVTQLTLKVKGEKTRIEGTPQGVTILDNKTGEMLTILAEQKIAMRASAAQAKGMMAALGSADANAPTPHAGDEKVKLTATGRKETINGFAAEEFIADTSIYKASYWIAKSYPQGDAILKQLQSMAPQALNTGAFAAPDFRDLPGLPIRINLTMGETKMVSTMKSISTDPLPETDFVVPPGIKELKVPDVGNFLNRQSGRAKPTASPNP